MYNTGGFRPIPQWRPAGSPPPAGLERWFHRAACAGQPGDWFADWTIQDVSREKAICEGCPVREECLAYALDAGEPHGIWGGLTATERRIFVWRQLNKKPTVPAAAAGSKRAG
jgi:hypothetical protein